MVKGRHYKIKRALLILALIILILILFAIGAYMYTYNKLSKTNYVELKNIEITEGVEEKLNGYRNIALFGVDARSDTYDKTRSDCIMIISINEQTNDVKLTSVYRDTYVYIDGHGYDKITHAYSYGGPELAINTLNKNLDLNISEFVAVNFDAVVNIIDSIGGISINIESSELNYINPYIESIDAQTGKSTPRVTKTGTQNLTGTQALAYSRIRYTAGGDYKRTERMRDVLNACFEKCKKLGVSKLNSLADILLPEIYTNVTTNEIISMVPDVAKYKVVESAGWPYQTKEYNPGVSYGVAVTLESNVKEFHSKIFNDPDYEVSSTVKKYSDEIVKKTGYK